MPDQSTSLTAPAPAKTWLLQAAPWEIEQIETWVSEKKKSGHELEIFFTGAGLLPAAASLARKLANTRPEDYPARILLAGTAGSTDENDLLTISLARHFIYPPFPEEEIPEFLAREFVFEPFGEQSRLQLTSPAPVFSCFGISTNPERFFPADRYWENMEALALAYLCRQHQLEFNALLACTNSIAANGRAQYKSNFKKAGELLRQQLDLLWP